MAKPVYLALAALSVALVLIMCLVLRVREPVYHGKKLTAWVEQYRTSRGWVEREEEIGVPYTAPDAQPPDHEAESAICHFGSNAVPMFVEMIKARESPPRLQAAELADHLPGWWLGFLHLPNSRAYRAQLEDRRRLGAYGLAALGSQAKAAVPELIELLKDKDAMIRWHAIYALRCLGPEAGAAVPSLIQCLNDPAVAPGAAIALGTIHQQPERVVPFLMQFIEKHRHNGALYLTAIGALSRFGPQAKPAVPLLLGRLNDEEGGTRWAATNALKVIDPEAATKAGVK